MTLQRGKERITPEQAAEYFSWLSPVDRDLCRMDEAAYGSWMIEIVEGAAVRVPPERWVKETARRAAADLYELKKGSPAQTRR